MQARFHKNRRIDLCRPVRALEEIRGGRSTESVKLIVDALLVPEDDNLYRHTVEGPDDMPAHIRTALTQTNLSIPLHQGRLALGTWQGIYLFEHRAEAHRRSVLLHLLGE